MSGLVTSVLSGGLFHDSLWNGLDEAAVNLLGAAPDFLGPCGVSLVIWLGLYGREQCFGYLKPLGFRQSERGVKHLLGTGSHIIASSYASHTHPACVWKEIKRIVGGEPVESGAAGVQTSCGDGRADGSMPIMRHMQGFPLRA